MTPIRRWFRNPRWRYVRTIAFVVLIGFVAFSVLRRLSANYDELEGQAFITGWRGAIAVFAFCLAVLTSGVLWRSTVRACSEIEVSVSSAVRAHTAAWLLKYVPGQVGAFAWKIAWGPRVGISRSQVSVAFIYEYLFLGITSTVPTIPIIVVALGTGASSLGWYLVAAVVIAVLFAVVSYAPILRRIVGLLMRVTKRGMDPDRLSFLGLADAMRLQGLYTLPRIANGLGFVAIVGAVHHVTPVDAIVLIAAYTLAGILGLLAIFVPSGIGVREAVIVLVCSRMMPVEVAAVVAINARIWATVADGFLGVGYLLARERKQVTT